MLTFRVIFVVFYALLCILLAREIESVAFRVVPNDSILMLGGLNTMTGFTTPNGFVNIIKAEVNSLVTNVTFINGGFANANGAELLERLDFILGSKVAISKAVLLLGPEILAVESVAQLRTEVESIVARLLADNIEVLLCPLVVNSERPDLPHELDDITFAFTQMNKQIARDYNVALLNLVPQLEKYWERNNMDGLTHSVLTLDGSVLNDHGHTFVALALLKGLGVEKHGLVGDNIVLREELRIQGLKAELQRVQVLDQSIEVSAF